MSKVNFEFSDLDKADLVARYNNLVSADKLAKEVGCSTPTMLRNLRSWGADIRGKGRLKGTKNAPKVTPVVASSDAPVKAVITADRIDAAESDSLDEPVVENHHVSVEDVPTTHGGGFFSRLAHFGR